MLQKIRKFGQKNTLIRNIVGYHLASSGLFDKVIVKYKLSDSWKKRINDVLSSPDNKFIPRADEAGKIKRGKQIMHNGLKIHLGSYYGPEYSQMLLLNKGVHEPQEERVFFEVLKTIPPNAVMIEMGAFWSFYSMWFNSEVKNARNFMIEPDKFNLGHGKRNFKLNNLRGNFVQAFVGKKTENNNPVKTICIDDFTVENNVSFIDMLHSDIQGYEYEMLQGAQKTFAEKKIGYVFISTHANDIHQQCLDFLNERQFIIIASANLDQSYSEDGLIAARAPYYPGINATNISLRNS
ncbi:MAG: FkbM family methyltransferase [Bacteroidetes bacterium]|nr:FkbM family methyltransferase [Bacteroidota bacterium]